jgi:hypothetical protein
MDHNNIVDRLMALYNKLALYDKYDAETCVKAVEYLAKFQAHQTKPPIHLSWPEGKDE